MILSRRLIAAATLIVGCAWLASSFALISVSPKVASILHATFLVFFGLGLIIDWRHRHAHAQAEPTPARSAVGVIAATGAVAVFITARGATTATEYFVPAIIAAATALLAFVTFRFASTHADQIGEARFDSSSNGS